LIVDTRHSNESTILKPSIGFLAGIAAALLMLLILYLLQSFSKILLVEVLERLGTIVLSGDEAPRKLVVAGVIIHLIFGGIFGLLYAVCQDQAPNNALIGVGISYGVMLWGFSSLFTYWFYSDTLRQVFHTWAWLLSSVGFGLTLAQTAIWVNKHRPKRKHIVPVD